MSYIYLFVALKITDNVARTAQQTMQTRLNAVHLKSVRRSDFWEMSFPGRSPQQARQIAETIVQKTAFFANPNKHIWRMEESEQPIEESGPYSFPSCVDASVLVCDRVDGLAEGTLEALAKLLDENQRPASLKRGVWWDMQFENLSPEAIRQETEKLTLTTSRKQGLLANPHYQSYQTFYADSL
ncbi:MAG: hypothetical protein AB1656_03310 [Candidatus Omnitrophota bacterium]